MIINKKKARAIPCMGLIQPYGYTDAPLWAQLRVPTLSLKGAGRQVLCILLGFLHLSSLLTLLLPSTEKQEWLSDEVQQEACSPLPRKMWWMRAPARQSSWLEGWVWPTDQILPCYILFKKQESLVRSIYICVILSNMRSQQFQSAIFMLAYIEHHLSSCKQIYLI